MANLFCVRAYYGEYTSSFVKGGYIAIGWLPSHDLSEIKSKDDVYDLYYSEYPEEDNNNVIGQKVGQIARFLLDIKNGDYVIVPGYDNVVYFGEVEKANSYYYFEGSDDCPFKHRRKTIWNKEPIDRLGLADTVQKSLRSNLTVFRINDSLSSSLAKIINLSIGLLVQPEVMQGIRLIAATIELQKPQKALPEPKPQKALPEARKENDGEIVLFYGTTRNKSGDANPNNFYGSNFDKNEQIILKLGSCKIHIPPRHKVGEIERPKSILFWQLSEKTQKHICLTDIVELDKNGFNNWYKNEVAYSTNKSALIFIHGFNTTFAEAAWRAGQITYDMPFNDNISGFFSWPSTGEGLDYGRDIERADASIPALIEFIENLVFEVGVQQLHFIAHSMGNRLLTRALIRLVAKDSFKDKVKSISQIILAAPDIDKTVFNNDILPDFKTIGERRTLYASDKDKALIASRKIRFGLSRIGEAGEDIFIADGIDTIDASNVMSDGNHHSYIFETKELLTDIYLLITEGFEPIRRRLRELQKQDLKYWIFPE